MLGEDDGSTGADIAYAARSKHQHISIPGNPLVLLPNSTEPQGWNEV